MANKVILEKLYDEKTTGSDNDYKEALISWKNIVCGNQYDYTLDQYLQAFLIDIQNQLPITEGQFLQTLTNAIEKKFPNTLTEQGLKEYLQDFFKNTVTTNYFIPQNHDDSDEEIKNISIIQVDGHSPDCVEIEDNKGTLYDEFGLVNSLKSINYTSYPKAINTSVEEMSGGDNVQAVLTDLYNIYAHQQTDISDLQASKNGEKQRLEQMIWKNQLFKNIAIKATKRDNRELLIYGNNKTQNTINTYINGDGQLHLSDGVVYDGFKFVSGDNEGTVIFGTSTVEKVIDSESNYNDKQKKIAKEYWENTIVPAIHSYCDAFVSSDSSTTYYGKVVMTSGWGTGSGMTTFFRSGQCYYNPGRQILCVDWRPVERISLNKGTSNNVIYDYKVGQAASSQSDYTIGGENEELYKGNASDILVPTSIYGLKYPERYADGKYVGNNYCNIAFYDEIRKTNNLVKHLVEETNNNTNIVEFSNNLEDTLAKEFNVVTKDNDGKLYYIPDIKHSDIKYLITTNDSTIQISNKSTITYNYTPYCIKIIIKDKNNKTIEIFYSDNYELNSTNIYQTGESLADAKAFIGHFFNNSTKVYQEDSSLYYQRQSKHIIEEAKFSENPEPNTDGKYKLPLTITLQYKK